MARVFVCRRDACCRQASVTLSSGCHKATVLRSLGSRAGRRLGTDRYLHQLIARELAPALVEDDNRVSSPEPRHTLLARALARWTGETGEQTVNSDLGLCPSGASSPGSTGCHTSPSVQDHSWSPSAPQAPPCVVPPACH